VQGREEGLAERKQQKAVAVALELKKMSLSVTAKATGLSIEQIEAL